MSAPLRLEDLAAVLERASAVVRRGPPAADSVLLKGDGSPVTALDREPEWVSRRVVLHPELLRPRRAVADGIACNDRKSVPAIGELARLVHREVAAR